MTTHYINFTVIPDPETTVPQLLGALFDRLHKALVDWGKGDIGVSFPQYSRVPPGMGNQIRLHAGLDTLTEFMQRDWLKGVRDHVRMTDIESAPNAAVHRTFTRKQFKTNVERLRRRRMKRKGETHAQAVEAIPPTARKKPNLPFAHLHSDSTQQKFHLFVSMGSAQPNAVVGEFNTYGLSKVATIPWF